jgi:ligand-binding sensor domain-containing protein/signal transduction histidine kinase
MLRAGVTLFFFVTLFWTQKCRAQLPAITFEILASKEGLPSNTVLSASRDQSGFMWFGTRQCPVRYDGFTFKSFTNFTTNFVTGIQTDKESNIWLSSDRSGVCVIESSTLQMSRVLLEGKSNAQTTGDFFIDKSGQGWYSDHDGVNRIDLKTRKNKHYPFRKTTFVWTKGSFVEDQSGSLWVIGRDNGLFKYDRQRDTLLCVLGADSSNPNQFGQILMSKACVDKEGNLWIGTYNMGLIKYNPQTKDVKTFETGRTENKIISVQEGWDENGKRILWVGDEQGLGIFRPDQNKFYFFPNIIPQTYAVNHIFRDPYEGIVWICTSHGIIKYNPRSNVIQAISIPAQVLPQTLSVNVIHQDNRPGNEHIYYLGLSGNTMVVWNRKSNYFSQINYPGDAADTRWIEQRDDETLWIGTNRWDYQRPGIFVYDLSSKKFLKPPLSILANRFFSVPFFMYGNFDSQKRLLIGNSDEGIHVLDEKLISEVTPWDSTAMKDLIKNNNLINDMMLDRNGRLWLGTYKGVYFYDEENRKFVNADPVPLPDKMDDSAVNNLLEDNEGNVWAARWGSLTMMNKVDTLQKVVTTNDGFYDRQIHGLVQDFAGNLWVGNHEGLYCFNPESNRLMRFTMNDGLLSNNTIDKLFVNGDKKEIFIAHINGFNLVKVDQLLKPVLPPPLVISSFKIHEKEYHVDFKKTIELKPSDNAFSVDFVALNYRKHDDNQYAYYLKGFEKDWNYSNAKHVAYYTNLNPGEYTLYMKAGDSFGNWNDDILEMRIEVLPAFYQTIGFKILVSLLIAGLLYILYLYRINQLLHLQQVRNRISADLHDELGSTLSGISIMGSIAKKELTAQHISITLVDRIMEDVRQISSSLDDIVWNISPKNDALSSLIARMTRYASELFEAKQIDFKLLVPDRFSDIKLSMDQRRNIYLIFKESVNNLVKYSKCTQALVSIKMDKSDVFLTIKDNGVGFDPTTPTDRNGIRNLKERSLSLKGVLDIQSARGKGTVIRLKFPIHP